MPFSFAKMHSLGNDFVITADENLTLSPDLIRTLADRRRGIGCDQFLSLRLVRGAAPRLSIWNQDGSPALACGNGTRCVVSYLSQISSDAPIVIQGPRWKLRGWIEPNGHVTVSQGQPRIGVIWDPEHEVYKDTPSLPLSVWGCEEGIPVDIGNPHLIIFVTQFPENWEAIGRAIHRHPAYPFGTNVSFVRRDSPEQISLCIWERGVGPTHACGSAACAAGELALSQGGGGAVRVCMPGGELIIRKEGESGILHTGPAMETFRGTWTDVEKAGLKEEEEKKVS